MNCDVAYFAFRGKNKYRKQGCGLARKGYGNTVKDLQPITLK